MKTLSDEELLSHSGRAKGKVVVITGAAHGIGREAALRFAKHGAKVVIGDLDVEGAARVVDDIVKIGGEAVQCSCDVLNWDDQTALFELAMKTYGAVDIVIPNAGVGELGHIHIPVVQDGRVRKPKLKTIEINIIGVMYTTHLALHYFKQGRVEGLPKTLIFIGSMASWQAMNGAASYAASKHAVLGFMRALYETFQADGIRVGVVHPWFAYTNILPDSFKTIMAGIPMTPVERIARTIFYASTDSDPETNGSVWLLFDDKLVCRLDKEYMKEGVYGLFDARIKAVVKTSGVIKHYSAIIRDLYKIFGVKLILFSLIFIVPAAGIIRKIVG